MFCPKCGSILIPKEVNKKRVMSCSCGYKSSSGDFTIAEQIKKKEKKLDVVDESKQETLPLTEAKCPECGHKKAYYWMMQTRAADEAETRFFRCEKCRHTWRDYF